MTRLSLPIEPAGYFMATAQSIGLDPLLAQILSAGEGSDRVRSHARDLMFEAAQRLAQQETLGGSQ